MDVKLINSVYKYLNFLFSYKYLKILNLQIKNYETIKK